MKLINTAICFLALLLAACLGNGSNNGGLNTGSGMRKPRLRLVSNSKWEGAPIHTSVSEIYARLPTLSLPFNYSYDFVTRPRGMMDLPAEVISELPTDNYFYFDAANAKAAKIDLADNFRTIVFYTNAESGEPAIYLFSYDQQMNPIDKIKLYEVAELDRSTLMIRKYAISSGGLLVVTTNIGSTVIEKLNYKLTIAGNFDEFRNGKCETIAYTTKDYVTFMVEFFIWDRNAPSGLIMRNHRFKYYTLADSGTLTQIDHEAFRNLL